jgi:hypothetical protein
VDNPVTTARDIPGTGPPAGFAQLRTDPSPHNPGFSLWGQGWIARANNPVHKRLSTSRERRLPDLIIFKILISLYNTHEFRVFPRHGEFDHRLAHMGMNMSIFR